MISRYILGLILLLTIHISFAQSSLELKGKVHEDSGEPLQAIVSIHELGKYTVADPDGNFSFKGLNEGVYHLHITHMGFRSYSKNVSVTQQRSELYIILKPSDILMDAMTVEANPFKNGPLEQSQTILIVDREFINKNNGGTFANSIEKLPGISTINTGVGISKPVIRGMSFNRIVVNDRGIKQEGQQWGADHGLEIDPFDVDRVEIIKGPASLMYGSDGMAGVINISPAGFMQNNEIELNYSGFYRSNNDMYSNSLALDGNEGDFVFRGRLTTQDYADYKIPADRFSYAGFILPIYENRLKNTAGKERHFSLMGGVQKKWGYSTITVSRFAQNAGIFVGAVGIPNSYNLRSDGDFRNIDIPNQDNSHLKVIWNNSIQIGKSWMEVDLGYQKNQREENSFPHNQGVGQTDFGNLALGLDLDVYTANLRFNKQHNEKTQSIIGFNAQKSINQKSGFEFLLPDFSSFQGGLFYFGEYKALSNLVFNAGLRLDGASHDIQEHLQPLYQNGRPTGELDQRNPDIERSFGNFSGSAGMSWVFMENFNLKFNFGSAFRIPTPIELATNGIHHGNFRHEVGNANLDGERSYQFDWNLAYSKPKFLITFSPFWGYFDQYIYLAPAPRFSPLPGASLLWEYRQDNAIFSGFELMSQFNPIKNLSFSLALEYVHSQNLNTGLPLPLTPPFSSLLGVEYKLPEFSGPIGEIFLFAEYRSVSAQERVDRNERITPGYHLLEMGLGWDLKVRNQAFKFQLSGQNLTNEVYFNHLSRYRLLNLPEQGRNISLSLNIPVSLR
ncbi:TonB-dependent receptor [Belliella sp. DSM 111904]|uniref:TonB-dependent receptor n=1 Tax=Belliella filtrata TaxID=2923435 RepID=A0ABS9V047_9BACT|nr:TonB-dependent receptor [Belliella filtrata]MCH7409373.1 TonB-dependent receptor [Belliella filtrata]